MGWTHNRDLAVIQIPRPRNLSTRFPSILFPLVLSEVNTFTSSSPSPSSSDLRTLGAGAGDACGDLTGSDDYVYQLLISSTPKVAGDIIAY
jgi:hypothetical protein